MKSKKRMLLVLFAMVMTSLVCQTLWQSSAHALDVTAPVITVTNPNTDPYIASAPVVAVNGTIVEDVALKQVTWDNDAGGAGFAQACTDWLGNWTWQASVPLSAGDNLITFYAEDAAGNSSSTTLLAKYSVTPPDEPTTIKGINLEKSKVKHAVFKNPSDPGDHCSIVTRLKKKADEVFVMPMDKDVTIILKVPDPNAPSTMIQIYSQTIPADTVPFSYTNYRYTSGGPGIRELTFTPSSATEIYFYVYIENVEFLRDIREYFRATLPPPAFPDDPGNYTDWLLSVQSLNVTIQIEDVAWRGDIPFTTKNGDVIEFTHRVEYRYNR